MRTALILILIACATLNTRAQPVLTFTSHGLDTTGSLIEVQGSYVSPGPGGANMSWDLSGAQPIGWQDTLTFMPASQGMGASYFPGAHVAMKIGFNYAFYNIDTASMSLAGASDGGAWNMVYSDVLVSLQFPCTYQTGWFDEAYGASQPNWVDTFTIATFADGYGTLITPAGVFNDVLRLHTVGNLKRVNDAGWTTDTYVSSYEAHVFYAPGQRYPVMQVWTDTVTSSLGGSNITQNSAWTTELTNALPDAATPGARYVAYPNPATDHLLITGALEAGSRIALHDAAGRVVRTARAMGNVQQEMDVSDLDRGSYLLVITDPRGVRSSRKVMLN